MAVAKNEIQIKWSSTNSVSVSAGGSQISDAATLSATAFRALVQVKADNAGTPASGDTLDVYALYSAGDPDADPDSADEFDTQPGIWLGRLDTYATTGGADPALGSWEIFPMAKSIKIRVVNNSGGRSMTVSAQVREATA